MTTFDGHHLLQLKMFLETASEYFAYLFQVKPLPCLEPICERAWIFPDCIALFGVITEPIPEPAIVACQDIGRVPSQLETP